MDELTRAEALELLAALDVGHVGTAAGGEPYVTPISYIVIGDEVLFRTLPGRRLDALRVNPRVCLEASRSDEDGNWESVIAWGAARELDDPNREADVVSALLSKYHDSSDGLLSFGSSRPFDPSPLVIAVLIDEISGRTSGRGFSPRTRPGRL